MSLKFYRINDTDSVVLTAATPEALLAQLRAKSHEPTPTLDEYREELRFRVEVVTGVSAPSPISNEALVDLLIDTGLITKVTQEQ